MDFIKILKVGNEKKIRNIIEIEQSKYYSTGSKTTIKIDLGFSIPNYEKLMNALGCDDSGESYIMESFGDETYQKNLTIYKTEIIGTYFVRLEEFGPADMDGMICYIIISDNIKEEAQRIIEEYKHKSVIKQKNLYI